MDFFFNNHFLKTKFNHFSKILKALLIDIFHFVGDALAGSSGCLVLDEVGHLLLDLVVFNAETELDHSVDSVGESSGLVQREAGSQQGGIEQEPDKILDGLVVLVGIALLLQLNDDGVVGVELHGFLGDHVGGH